MPTTHDVSNPGVDVHPGRDCECPDCGLFQRIPALPANARVTCRRCEATLRRTRPFWETRALSLAVTSLVIYLIAISQPFISVDIFGKQRETVMATLPLAFWEEGAWILAVIVGITAILAPLVKIVVLIVVLAGLRVAQPPRYLPAVFKWYRRVGPWAMVEVFLLGVFVAFTRLGAIATTHVGNSLYAIGALMLTMVAADFVIDVEGVWQRLEQRGLVAGPEAPRAGAATASRISCGSCGLVNYAQPGEPCRRCGSALHVRHVNSVGQTWAFLAAGILLYIPANVFPVLTITKLGHETTSTILAGAKELLDAGMWPLALLVFVASLMVPLMKLVCLIVMLITTQRGSAWRLRDRTRIYRLVEFIGRWSMIDVFMMATLVGLVQAGNIALVKSDFGAVCFGSVVVVTMLAAQRFDPRMMWDAVPERERQAASAEIPSAARAPRRSEPKPA